MSPVRISVVVPSFRRPHQLARCLDGLESQSRAVDEIVVVRRIDDLETAATIARARGVRETMVCVPGGLAPLRAGAAQATGDVIAFIDDDAVARPDWLLRIARWFDDPGIGGVGGRDVLHGPEFGAEDVPRNGLTSDVGRVTRLGRLIGNHHRGNGPARDVEILKGVNIALRRAALALPAQMRGNGTQMHWEVAVSLHAMARGWRLVFDPLLRVDHYPAARPNGDGRVRPSFRATRDATYNYAVALLSFRPELARRHLIAGLLVGGSGDPGLGRAAAGMLRGDLETIRRMPPSLLGRLEGVLAVAAGYRIKMIETPQGERMTASRSA